MDYWNSQKLRKPTQLEQLDDQIPEKLSYQVRSILDVRRQSRLQVRQ